MADSEAHFIDVSQLRLGLYVYLDLGWMAHPFALNSFKITTQEQIDTIRNLGIERIRYAPALSDPAPPSEAGPAPGGGDAAAAGSPVAAQGAGGNDASPGADEKQRRREGLAAQRASLQLCENQFTDAARVFRQVVNSAHAQPDRAREKCEAMIGNLVGNLAEQEETCIRLLSEKAGEKIGLHAVNVTVLSLLLGKAMALEVGAMLQLGTGALVHDIGKMDLPDRLRWVDDHFGASERQAYREHVDHGVAIAKKMRLTQEARLIISQHHEFNDGSGYPQQLSGEQISTLSRIVILANHYDNLCNPMNPAVAITPHEALALIYAQSKRQFDPHTLALFIRMMGVYPPGSVIELTDGRYAMVTSVNSSRPLRPHVLIHDPATPPSEALTLDLGTQTDLGIRCSLKPLQLPKAAYDYLSPRKRLCYFFERAREAIPARSVE